LKFFERRFAIMDQSCMQTHSDQDLKQLHPSRDLRIDCTVTCHVALWKCKADGYVKIDF